MAASLSFLRPPHQLIGEVADGYQIAGILLSSEIYIWKAGICDGCDFLVYLCGKKYFISYMGLGNYRTFFSLQKFPLDGVNLEQAIVGKSHRNVDIQKLSAPSKL